MTMADPLDDVLRRGDPAGEFPTDLTARIIAQVPRMAQAAPEPVARIGGHGAQVAPAAPVPAPRRRYLVPLGLGGLAAAAASLAAVFLSSAQGWQGPAIAPAADGAAAVAVQAPQQPVPASAAPAASLSVPELAAAAAPQRKADSPAIRPAATPVMAQASAGTAPAVPEPVATAVQELAIHADDTPIQQLSPAEAAAVERRAERRAARDAAAQPGAAPTAMGLRSGAVAPASTGPAQR